MKQFIILLGVLPILLLFLSQFVLEQKNSYNIGLLQEYVYAAKEEAKQAGCFTPAIKEALAEKISARFEVSQDQIAMAVDQVPRYRTSGFDERELIHYRIGVPIEKVMAGNRFMGISNEENRGNYVIESWTASEKLRDQPE